MIEALSTQLSHLDCDYWKPVLTTIARHYDGSTANAERWDPDIQLLLPLSEIDEDRPVTIDPNSGATTRDHEIARYVSELDCFCIRVMHNTPSGPILWNSLVVSYRKFVFTSGAKVQSYLAPEPYPPKDLIRATLLHRIVNNAHVLA
ncbi:MAG: hypothetical protein V3W04_09535 [Gammaproteobacteria bacterium]